MKRTIYLIGATSLLAISCVAQSQKRPATGVDRVQQDAAALSVGDVALFNLTQAEEAQVDKNPNYIRPEPKTREKVTEPGILVFQNPDRIERDWTAGQHARSLVENLRVAIWTYQAGPPNPAGTIGVPQAVEVWPKLRNIFCREYPGARYIDLQGQVQFCGEKSEAR